MQAREATTSSRSRFPQSDLLLLALQIAVPVGVVDLIGGGGPLSALSIFSVPFSTGQPSYAPSGRCWF